MKKLVKFLSLTMVVVMLLSSVAFAADAANERVEVTAQEITGYGVNVTLEKVGTDDVVNVKVSGNGIEAGEQYLVLMVKTAADGTYTIDQNSILYIDQTASATGEFSFKVYPSSLADSVILITNAKTGQLKVAIVDALYAFGDLNKDDLISILDIMVIVDAILTPGASFDEGDLNGDGIVSILDIMVLVDIILTPNVG